MSRRLVATGIAILFAGSAFAAKLPDAWDGMVRVKAKRIDAVYLLPQADFRPYTQVIIDPTEVAFRKNWQRDTNSVTGMGHIRDSDARRILDEAREGFQKILAAAYVKAGYRIATAPGPDVLRLSTAVINLDVTAPDEMTAGRTYTFSRDAGGAQLVLEARDSLSGQLLGRAIDGRAADDIRPFIRNSVTNRAAFEDIFSTWAKISADGLSELKALSPIDANGTLRR